MSVETLQLLVSAGGLLLAAVGVPLLWTQLRDVKRSLRGEVHAAMYNQAANVRSHLVEYPQLRKYFFDGAEITPDDAEYDRVATIAELFLNYLEHTVVLGDSFGKANRPALERFCRLALERSPIMRRHLAENEAAYSDALHGFIGMTGARAEVGKVENRA